MYTVLEPETGEIRQIQKIKGITLSHRTLVRLSPEIMLEAIINNGFLKDQGQEKVLITFPYSIRRTKTKDQIVSKTTKKR